MDVILYKLMEFGISKSLLEKNILNEIHYSDIFYPNKRYIESKIFNTAVQEKLIEVVKSNNLHLSTNAIDSIYILSAFGCKKITIDKLFDKSIRRITNLEKLHKSKVNNYINKNTDLEYNSLMSAISLYKNWQQNNPKYLIEIFILEFIQQERIDDLIQWVYMRLKSIGIIITESEIVTTLTEMESVHSIQVLNSGNSIELNPLSIQNLLKYRFKDNNVFIDRLKGMTFADISINEGNTRSRVQQKYARLLNRIPILDEEIKYSDIFMEYNISEKEFKDYVVDDIFVYNFFDSKYKQGDKEFSEYLVDYQFSESEIHKYALRNNKFINSKQQMLPINIINIFDEFIMQNRKERFTYLEARELFNEFSSKYGLKPYKETDKHTFKVLVNRSLLVIKNNQGSFRYFDMNDFRDEDIEILYDCFNLTEGVYGAQYIFNMNVEVLEPMGFENGYEILDFIKQRQLSIPSINKIVRRSEVYIGKITKYDFIGDFLSDYNGENVYDIISLISEEYGIRENSLTEYTLRNFDEYITDNIINLTTYRTDVNEIKVYLREILVNSIYLIREVNERLSNHFNEKISVNNEILQGSGFKTNRRFIYSDKFETHNKAMEAEILKNRSFPIPNNKLANDALYYKTRVALQKEFKLFRFNRELYITDQVLLDGDIYRKDIESFINNVVNFIKSNGGFFTYHKLVRNGFNDQLVELGFENIFYEYILYQSDELSLIQSKTIIFYIKTDYDYTVSEFIYMIILELKSIDYQELLDLLNYEYGFKMDIYELKYKLSFTDAFYSNETEKYYSNKNQYYLEVYGK